MISILLVTSSTDLDLCGNHINFVQYQSIGKLHPQMANINNAHSVYFLVMFILLVTLHVNLELGLEHTVVVQY